MTTRSALFALLLGLVLAPAAWADEEGETPPAEPAADAAADTGAATKETPTPTPLVFEDDFAAARERAQAEGRPLLVVAVPDWYESPHWKSIEEEVLAKPAVQAPLAAFVRVLVKESRDREVHVRHRVPLQGYPLSVVLDADGTYLGFLAGLPEEGGAAKWPESVAAIPPRARRIAEVRAELATKEEDAALLFELGTLLVAHGETERAVAIFERMERAAPLAAPERLGEARYQRLRIAAVNLFEQRKFADVETLCLRWRRRFSEHARAPDILLLQANARYLTADHDGAKELWTLLEKEHEDTPAGKKAADCLKGL